MSGLRDVLPDLPVLAVLLVLNMLVLLDLLEYGVGVAQGVYRLFGLTAVLGLPVAAVYYVSPKWGMRLLLIASLLNVAFTVYELAVNYDYSRISGLAVNLILASYALKGSPPSATSPKPPSASMLENFGAKLDEVLEEVKRVRERLEEVAETVTGEEGGRARRRVSTSFDLEA